MGKNFECIKNKKEYILFDLIIKNILKLNNIKLLIIN